MNNHEAGNILLLVLIVVGILSLFVSLLFGMQTEGVYYLNQKTQLFSMRQSAVRELKADGLLDNDVLLSCDLPAISLRNLLRMSDDWWKAHACFERRGKETIYLIREPPYLSQSKVILKDQRLFLASYRYVVVRVSRPVMAPVFMAGFVAEPSKTRALQVEHPMHIRAGLQALEPV